jgi:hypothetical protein
MECRTRPSLRCDYLTYISNSQGEHKRETLLKIKLMPTSVPTSQDKAGTFSIAILCGTGPLLDKDRVQANLQRHLTSEVGPRPASEYWQIFNQGRAERSSPTFKTSLKAE